MAHEKQLSDSGDEQNLFEEAMQGVVRIEANLAPDGEKQREPKQNNALAPDEGTLTRHERGARKSGIQEAVLRNLRSGRIQIEAQLDLHGYTQSEARPALEAFLEQSQAADYQRAVRVIHGKGLGSRDGQSALREVVMERLRQSSAVLAYCEAGPNDGGSGAVRVLLKRRP